MSEQSKPTFALLNLEAIRDNRYDPDFDEFTEQDAHEILNYIAELEAENSRLATLLHDVWRLLRILEISGGLH